MKEIITEPDERISPNVDFFRGRGDTVRPGLLFFFHHFDYGPYGAVRGGAARWIKHGHDLVQIQCWKNDSYLSIPADEVAAARDFAISRGYAARYGVGTSMGGFGALLLAAELDLDRVLAIAPRWLLLDETGKVAGIADEARLEALASSGGRSLARTGPRTEVIVLSDPYDRMDAPLVAHLRQHIPAKQLRLIRFPHAGHMLYIPFGELKLHPDQTSALLQTGDVGAFRKRIVRRDSKSMMLGLARFLAEKGRLDCAATIYDQPVCHGGTDSDTNLRDRYLTLSRLGRKQDLAQAVTSPDAERIVKLVPVPENHRIIEAAVECVPDAVLADQLESWTRVKPLVPWRALRLGERARELGKPASAIALLSGRCHPKQAPQRRAAVVLAEIWMDIGQPYEAVMALRDWLACEPGADLDWPMPRILREAQRLLSEADKPQQALEAVELFLEYKDEGWMYFHRARLLTLLDRPEEAIASLMAGQSRMASDPSFAEASGKLVARLTEWFPHLAVSAFTEGVPED